MTTTLLAAVQRVARKVGNDATISSFSTNDESLDLAHLVWDAYERLISLLPIEAQEFAASDTITTANGTRLYSLASDATPYGVYQWSWENETSDDERIDMATLDYLRAMDIRYDEDTGQPVTAYFDSGQVGFYPVPDGVYSIKYQYRSLPARTIATGTTFEIPDHWVRFLTLEAEANYKMMKGFEEGELVLGQANEALNTIHIDRSPVQPATITPIEYF